MPRAAVVGKGLFGVAAALHLARAGWDVVVAGPDEPADDAGHTGPHGAHFDEARILVARGNRAETDLTISTILGVMELEDESGETLLNQSGSVEVSARGPGVELVDGVSNVGEGAEFVEVAPPQGFYNPRGYVRTGVRMLEQRGVRVVRLPVGSIRRGNGGFVIDAGEEISADRVVVAAGAWSNRLLNEPVALRLKREHVIFAQLSAEVAQAIAMRPTVFYGRTGAVEDIYTLPPLPYPDDNWYLKLGANTLHDEVVAQDGEIDAWYHSGDSSVAEEDLIAAFHIVFPEVPVEAFHTERCVITYTAHGRPYIDEVDDGLVLCAGGNGHGASWADGAGKLAAALVVGEAWEGLDRESFRVIRANEQPEWPQPLLMRDRG